MPFVRAFLVATSLDYFIGRLRHSSSADRHLTRIVIRADEVSSDFPGKQSRSNCPDFNLIIRTRIHIGGVEINSA